MKTGSVFKLEHFKIFVGHLIGPRTQDFYSENHGLFIYFM